MTTESAADQYLVEISKAIHEFKDEEKSIKMDRERLSELKTIGMVRTEGTDAISLNVGGEIIVTTRATLTRIPKSLFNVLFHGRWEDRLPSDFDSNFFFDFNPQLFRHLLAQLRTVEDTEPWAFYPPNRSPRTVQSFDRMLRKLRFPIAPPSPNDVIVMNVGGKMQVTRQQTLLQSQIPILMSHSSSTNGQVFFDAHPNLFCQLINRLRKRTLIKLFDYRDLWAKFGRSFYEMIRTFGFNSESKKHLPSSFHSHLCRHSDNDDNHHNYHSSSSIT